LGKIAVGPLDSVQDAGHAGAQVSSVDAAFLMEERFAVAGVITPLNDAENSAPPYAKVTEELTLLWARMLLRLNPDFSFCYCSAMGADGNTMWARVRRRVEGELRAMPFRYAGCVRPGFIEPGRGIRSTVRFYQTLITVFRPLLPLLVRALPSMATTSARLGRAMLRIVQGRADRFILESTDINRIADSY